MTNTFTWTTLANACVLFCYLYFVQYVNSETSPSAISLKDVDVADGTKLPLTTSPTHNSTWTTQFLDTYTVSTEVDLQPSPTYIPESTTVGLPSDTYSRDVTPQLTTQDFSKLSPLDDSLYVSTQTMSIFSYSERTTSFVTNSSLSNTISPTTSSSIVDKELSSTQFTSTFSTTTNNEIANTTLSSFTSSLNISSKNSTNTSSLTSVITSPSTSSTVKPGTSTVLGHHNVTLNVTRTTTGSTAVKPGKEDRLHKEPDEDQLNTPAIIGIGFGAAAFVLMLIGIGLLVMKKKVYRRNKHDPSNFWDDNVTLSYINSHADFPKDFDAEMMSLDDDSFLNSLDSVTFANIWAADTAKHTNF